MNFYVLERAGPSAETAAAAAETKHNSKTGLQRDAAETTVDATHKTRTRPEPEPEELSVAFYRL